MKTTSFDHKLFVRKVQEITGCTHDQAFDVLGIVVEHTQRAWMQGVNHSQEVINSLKSERQEWKCQVGDEIFRTDDKSVADEWRKDGLDVERYYVTVNTTGTDVGQEGKSQTILDYEAMIESEKANGLVAHYMTVAIASDNAESSGRAAKGSFAEPDCWPNCQVKTYTDGEPCGHPGCQNHVTHGCERCGRIQAHGEVSLFRAATQRESGDVDGCKQNETKS
jgi:hypothetical protein